MKDSEADPTSSFRPVDIVGNVACIEKDDKLINAVIAEVKSFLCHFDSTISNLVRLISSSG